MGKRQWGNPSMKGLSSASPKPSLCSHNRSPSTVVTQDVADFHVKWIRWGFFFNITFSYAFWILCMRLFSGLCLILSILLYPVILHVLGSAICEPGRGLPTAVWFPVSSSLLQTGLALGAWSLRGSFGLHLLSAGRSIHGPNDVSYFLSWIYCYNAGYTQKVWTLSFRKFFFYLRIFIRVISGHDSSCEHLLSKKEFKRKKTCYFLFDLKLLTWKILHIVWQCFSQIYVHYIIYLLGI